MAVKEKKVHEVDTSFDHFFLRPNEKSIKNYKEALLMTFEAIIEGFVKNDQPYSGKSPYELKELINQLSFGNEEKMELEEVLSQLQHSLLSHSLVISHPSSIAHLHCQPMIPALAAEMLISAMNQSMDSWDQSPAATHLEEKVSKWLCKQFGYNESSDGVFTSGGTQSNYMGLLLARDYYFQTKLKWNVQQKGLPSEASRLRVLCSEHAHFTVKQSAAQLGLGHQAVVPIKTDQHYRMCINDIRKKLLELKENNLIPFAIVATAGTTDFGSIDPLAEIAKEAKKQNLWLHVDAAYGGALVLSGKYRNKLIGIERADSITVDFHKLFYQPISCGAFLLKEASNFQLMKLNADYLNPEEDEQNGMVHLVDKSVQTTRRFDALKLYISLQTIGIKTFEEMVNYTISLAQETGRYIKTTSNLELCSEPEINAVLFRYRLNNTALSKNIICEENDINQMIQRNFLESGKLVIAKTKVNGKVYLKFTILNPCAELDNIKAHLEEIQALGMKIEKMIMSEDRHDK
ncbi:pyridoxal phosphate-dependent decarboxylase family protein [Metabacillus fastidiosus]|uniref:pyridoxal phosphate-dependent decarboxylase family protein n=1 Tax=Metabacillus fastidiosus TaxID=1458 RepID=UPI003D298FB5